MENNNVNEKSIFPAGLYMLMWFTNPDNISDSIHPFNQSLSTQLFTKLEDAENMANFLSGSRVILMCYGQNPNPESNVYWSKVKQYGDNWSFDLHKMTFIDENTHKLIKEKQIK